MSDEEFDITGSLALQGKNESDFELSSESDFEDNEEIQDIVSSDDEGDKKPKKKNSAKQQKGKKPDMDFPQLELSDDEDGGNKTVSDLSQYFVQNNPTVKKAKAGSFASFGLSKFILSNISKKGYKQPTPIQRKTLPLIMEGRDVVGMARTGSGKTAAFVLPVIEKLKAHTAKVGARAVILSPSRELALQTFKQVKEFSRGTDLRSIVLIGGDSMDEQFSLMMSNPDIIVATPGRFLHLKVEMQLDLSTVEYIVFDEADRLFEMGFAEQLNELIAALPDARQSLLFSATLPKNLVEFAKAGLTNPVLVRLDAETTISENLQMAFFATKKSEREASLLHILLEVIHLPLATPEQLAKIKRESKKNEEEYEEEEEEKEREKNGTSKNNNKKKFRKERLPPANVLPSPYSTLVFVPTKHHVEYITGLLRDAGYLASYIYGSLDQRARKEQLYQFRVGLSTVLVVTDVAARGIDIPVLANVINYTLPASSKIFVHRVGRTARAGNKGWAYSIVNEKELPYLLDLEIFLGKKILLTSMHEKKCEILKQSKGSEYVEPKVPYTERLVLGAFPRTELETFQEMFESLLNNNYDLKTIKDVASKGEKLYHRTRQPASTESVKRTKELVETGAWDEQHLLFGPNLEKEKERFLAKLQNRNVKETVFEFTKKGKEKEEDGLAQMMQRRRRQIAPLQRKAGERRELLEQERMRGLSHAVEDELLKGDENEVGYNVRSVDDSELATAFEDADNLLDKKKNKKKTFRDPQFYMGYHASGDAEQDISSFTKDAANAAFDLGNDDKLQKNTQVMKWDKKKGRYVNSRSTDNTKYIIGENGNRIPASLRSGKFDEWKKKRNILSLHEGMANERADGPLGNKKFKHNKVSAPKLPDKFRDDFHKQKKKVNKAVESGVGVKGYNRPGQNEHLRSADDIRKMRQSKDKRRAKNARPQKRRK